MLLRTSCIFLALLTKALALAAPNPAYTPMPRTQNYIQAVDIDSSTKELRSSLEALKHQVQNHETELRTLDEKLSNDDAIVDNLRQQVNSSLQNTKDYLKTFSSKFEETLKQLDDNVKALSADLKKFQQFSQETAGTLQDYKNKIAFLEKSNDSHNKNIESLHSALRSLMDALQGKEISTADADSRIYTVKSGDTLEKIARQNQTTIQAIRDANQLSRDRIIVGQKLRLPE